jgi:hypothetical protein
MIRKMPDPEFAGIAAKDFPFATVYLYRHRSGKSNALSCSNEIGGNQYFPCSGKSACTIILRIQLSLIVAFKLHSARFPGRYDHGFQYGCPLR